MSQWVSYRVVFLTGPPLKMSLLAPPINPSTGPPLNLLSMRITKHLDFFRSLGGGQSGTLTFFWNQLLTGQHLANFGAGAVKKNTLYILETFSDVFKMCSKMFKDVRWCSKIFKDDHRFSRISLNVFRIFQRCSIRMFSRSSQDGPWAWWASSGLVDLWVWWVLWADKSCGSFGFDGSYESDWLVGPGRALVALVSFLGLVDMVVLVG